MITNTDVFNALKTLEMFCASFDYCKGCPFTDEECMECALQEKFSFNYGKGSGCCAPCCWNVESLRPLLDPASTTLDP